MTSREEAVPEHVAAAPGQATAPPAAAAEAASASNSKEAKEEFPDPDEDDLDDLDDVLDQFSSHPAASGPGRPEASAAPEASAGSSTKDRSTTGPSSGGNEASGVTVDASLPSSSDAEIFASQLQKEMAALMGEIDNSPSMQHQIDAMMAELSMGVSGSDSKAAQKAAAQAIQEAANLGGASGAEGASSGGAGGDFQATIQRTMERMQASGASAEAAANVAAGGSETDMLEALLKEMAAAGGGGEGGEEEFSQMLLGMMEQLTNKEILYEPMKDLHDKFPAWLKAHDGTTANTDTGADEKIAKGGTTAAAISAADLSRYREQQGIVAEIVTRFERPGYSDENPADREFIVERMQKMQALGSPPEDLVGDMKEATEAMGDLDGGCAQQ